MDAWFDVTQHLYTTVAEHYMWGWIALALVPWAIAVTAYAIWKLVLTRKIYESDYLDQVFLKNQIFGISSFTTRVSIDGEFIKLRGKPRPFRAGMNSAAALAALENPMKPPIG